MVAGIHEGTRIVLRGVTRLLGQLREDVQTVRDRDPAALSRLEVVLTTPGLHAI